MTGQVCSIASMRRRASLVLYAGGGLHLSPEGVLAFLGGTFMSCKAPLLLVLASVGLVYLVAAAVVSQGSRIREIGIALLATAGWVAAVLAVAALAVALLDSAGRGYLLDLRYFDAWLYGSLNLFTMVTAGLLLARAPGRRSLEAPDPA